MPYSFQDELARLQAETDDERERAQARAGRQHMLDYQRGVAIARDIAVRTAGARDDIETKIGSLRRAIPQGASLMERVIAGRLAEEISYYAAEAERQRPQRVADANYYARAQELWDRHYAAAQRERDGRHR